MELTRDCYGIPFRLVCSDCYNKLMEYGDDCYNKLMEYGDGFDEAYAEGFFPGFKAIICVPENVDEEEYIDDLLEGIMREEVWENTVWDFD